MISFEQELKAFLTAHNVPFSDYGSSYDKPDFYVVGQKGDAWVEVKEKRQSYATSQWPVNIPEHYAFILDELTARKLMQYVDMGALFVRDNTTGLYYFADVMSLWLMDRTRCERNHNDFMKGKWVLDLRNFYQSDNIFDLFVFLRDYIEKVPALVGRDASIYRRDFVSEKIEQAGTPRTREQKEHDIQETR